MKKLINSKLLLQVFVASIVATLATVGIVAATTIGTNISTGGTLDVTGASTLTGNTAVTGTLGVTGLTTLVNASTTLMTVAGKSWLNGNATIADGKGLILGSSATAITGSAGMIYYDTTNSVIKMNDGTSWFTVGTSTSGLTLSGSKLQLADLSYYGTIGTTTAQGLSVLTVEATSTAAIPLTLVARDSQTANLFQIRNSGSANLLYINYAGGLYASSTLQATGNAYLYGTLNVDGLTALGYASTTQITTTNSAYLATTGGKAGIGTTSPFATLSIDTNAGENAFVIGSSTATYLTVGTTGNLEVDTNTLLVDAVNNRVGIGSTTPTATFAVGNLTAATSSIDFSKPCFRMAADNGTVLYYWPSLKAGVLGGWATSTASCF